MEQNVGLVLTKRAHLSPGLEAVVDVEGGRRLSYAQLDARANRAAAALRGLGVAKGDRVGLLLGNGPEFLEVFFGIAKLGAVAVPINWRLLADEVAFILRDCGARTLVFGEQLADTVAELRSAETDVRQFVRVGGPGKDAGGPVREYEDLLAAASDGEPPVVARGDDVLYIMYTSGTTGRPKGAVHTHSTALWAVITTTASADTRFGDRYLVVLPLFHVGALTPAIGNVYAAATNVVMRSFDPRRIWRVIEEERITTAMAVPAMLSFMLATFDPDAVDCSSLRWIVSGAAPVPVSLIESYAKLGIDVLQVYGLTESCGPGCLIGPDEALARRGSTGKAFFHTEVRVADDEGRTLPPGEPGELLIRGPHVMKEYWNLPEATAETLRDGWLRSGDVAIMDEEGYVYIQDRSKDMIISGGENVYPAELEDAILSHPKVAEVAVIGQQSARWGESPLAVVVRSDASLTAQEVLDHCRGRLAPFKRPRAVEFVDQIPRNATGKILKRELRERFPGPAPE